MTIKMAGIFLYFILLNCVAADNKSFLSNLENKLEDNICRYANYATKYLEDFNDKNLGKSEIGRLLGYEDLKPKLSEESGRQGKSMKKMSMALMPLIFHIGASSTWMLITTLLAAKSVAIGLLLLIFKIAVSSAKVSSYFTSLKAKQHHEYSWSPSVEHGHYRSIDALDLHPPSDWHSPYSPEWVNEPPTNDYKTIPAYERINKNIQELNDIEDSREIKRGITLSSS